MGRFIGNVFFKTNGVSAALALIVLTLTALLAGCLASEAPGASDSPDVTAAESSTPPEVIDYPFEIPEIPAASAPGLSVAENSKATIDYSNVRDGYVMMRFSGSTTQEVRALVVTPDQTQYQYRLTPGADYSTFPLTGGDGEYAFSVWEHVEDAKFAQVVAATVDVTLDNEFVPFLRPNQFVNYSKYSKAVIKAAELTADISNPLEIIDVIYNYVFTNISYDEELAKTVQSGYLPDIDAVLEKRTGICFDYAALTAAMLRSQGVPTRMIFGYTGEDYHAWISVYTEETGWIENIIHFDGVSWNLMDPTFAAGAYKSGIQDFVAAGGDYKAALTY